jgi:formylmethanofuran dehydrogenase subunit B
LNRESVQINPSLPNVDVLSSAYLEGIIGKNEKPRSHDVKLKLENLANTLQKYDEDKLKKLLDKLEANNTINQSIVQRYANIEPPSYTL